MITTGRRPGHQPAADQRTGWAGGTSFGRLKKNDNKPPLPPPLRWAAEGGGIAASNYGGVGSLSRRPPRYYNHL